MTFVVIYDANVLYPSTLRDVLIRLAQTGLVQAKWTETILDETFRSLHAKRPDLDETRLQRTRNLMNLAVRDPVVTGYEPLISSLHLPDLDDRHVLAAAIWARPDHRHIQPERLSHRSIGRLGRRGQTPRRLPGRPVPPGRDQRTQGHPSRCRLLAEAAGHGQRRTGPPGPCRTPSDRGRPTPIAK